MFQEVFTWNATWKDIDIAEIVSGNEDYCKKLKTVDSTGCLAHLYFFQSKSQLDAEKIDQKLTSFWVKLTKDFFTMKSYE
jgi:hypothetical protein